MYMLDTNICIYIIKQRPFSVQQQFEQMSVGSVAVSLVTYGELFYGALRSQSSAKALEVLEEWIRYVPVLAMQKNVADVYGGIRADLSAKGNMIGNNDLWIAAHALSMDCTLVTNNLKEFERVEGLRLENWV